MKSQRIFSSGLFNTAILKILLVFFVISNPLMTVSGSNNQVSRSENILSQDAPSVPSGTHKTYIPVMDGRPKITVYGAFLDTSSSDQGMSAMVTAGANWNHIPFSWNAVEPNPGQWNWAAAADTDSKLALAAANHLLTIIYIEDTPGWALKAGYACGAVAQNRFADLATFLSNLVRRYSAAPYNATYYELWNEPEAIGTLGCWGNQSDLTYDGGGYYGEMLKVAYPAIKAANPRAQVIFGGMVLDCNPDVAGLCSDVWKKSIGHFLEGALVSGAGPYFDGISFHAYDYYQGALGQYANPNWGAAWNTTGPVALVKADFLKGVLSKYGLTGKNLMNTETGMLCGSTGNEAPCTTTDHATTLSNYVIQDYAGAEAKGLTNMIWFSVAGWRGDGLLDSQLSPLPSYSAYRTVSSLIGKSNYVGPITQFSGIAGYSYVNNLNQHTWVLWSVTSSGNPKTITLNTLPLAVYNFIGTSMPVKMTVSVGLQPVFITFGS